MVKAIHDWTQEEYFKRALPAFFRLQQSRTVPEDEITANKKARNLAATGFSVSYNG